jgi:chromosome segregation ATPase
MRLRRLEIALLLALGVILVASTVVIYRLSKQLAAYRQQLADDAETLRKLRAALAERELQKVPAEGEESVAPGDERAALAKRNATIEQLNQELAEAQASMADLQAQLARSNDEREKALAAASERERQQREDWQNQLDSLKQELDSVQAETQASRQRIAALEAENAKLKEDNSAGSARAAEVARLVASLQDLDRRRDAYLTSIMRRYRDITNQFRAMTGMVDTSRDPSSGAFTSAELTRIQNAVTSADDDLRQLSELNNQARQIEKKLARK